MPNPARHYAYQAFSDGSVAIKRTWQDGWIVDKPAPNAPADDCLAADFARTQNEFMAPWVLDAIERAGSVA